MKICAAQTKSFKGDIEKNIEAHKKWIEAAIDLKANLIFFPELSLTGYEPELAEKLATHPDDERFDVFQQISDANKIIICVGIPVKSNAKPSIGLLVFQPQKARQLYCKQYLHDDELHFFSQGNHQIFLDFETHKIAPAICYESLLTEHCEHAFNNSSDIYMAGVAKSAQGVAKAFKHFPAIAAKYSMIVLMANSVGYCDNFESAGTSAVWNINGELVGKLDDISEGIFIFDSITGEFVSQQ